MSHEDTPIECFVIQPHICMYTMSTSTCPGWNARENDAISVFMDTGAFVGARNSGDNRHKLSVEAIGKVLNGAFGAVYTSDYVIDEAVTLALARNGRPGIAFDRGFHIQVGSNYASED